MMMVAVSIGESESLKMQDSFKRYVKLSSLKIYVLCVYKGLKLLFLFSAPQWSQKISGVKTWVTKNNMRLQMQVNIQHAQTS